MKKLLLLILLLLIPVEGHALSSAIQAVVGVNTVGCGVTDSQETGGTNNYVGDEVDNSFNYKETSFTASQSVTIKTVYLNVADAGSPTGLTVALCTDNAGAPGTCTNADATITTTTATAQWLHVNFTAGYAVTAATKYHIRVYYPYSSGYYNWLRNPTVTGQGVYSSPDGTTWTPVDASSQTHFRISTCED